MADGNHLALVQAGSGHVNQHRAQHPETLFDLSEAVFGNINLNEMNLTGANLRGANLTKCVGHVAHFDNADLTGAILTEGQFTGATFTNANLSGCKIQSANLEDANFQKATLSQTVWANTNLQKADLTAAIVDGANFSNADLSNAKISRDQILIVEIKGALLKSLDLSGIDLSGRDLPNTDFSGSKLEGADFSRAKLFRAQFANASLERAKFERAYLESANFNNANLNSAIFEGANLSRADFSQAILREANISGADLFEAVLTAAHFSEMIGAPKAKHLATAVVGMPHDIRYFDRVNRDWTERWLDWEKIRIVGRLPLLGVSYTGLITIPVFVYILGVYNENVELLKAWLRNTAGTSAGVTADAVSEVIKHLHARPIPSRFFILFVSTLFLAAAATIYTVACPSRVKSFTRDQWCDELGKPLVHYWPEAWMRRKWRVLCAVLYGLGGSGAVCALYDKLWRVADILYHSGPIF
jgi:uncharacterized protein YjbI with pentapeptide repeats